MPATRVAPAAQSTGPLPEPIAVLSTFTKRYGNVTALDALSLALRPGEIVTLIYMPMAVMGGLWIPLSMLPHWRRSIAPVLPAYHLARITLHIFGYQNSSSYSAHWFGLTGFTLLMLSGSWAASHRAERNG